MPSDSFRGVPAALRPAMDEFHSQLAIAFEEVKAWRTKHEEAVADPAGVLSAELGVFHVGLLDPAHLAALVAVEEAPDPLLHHLMRQARDRFSSLLQRGDQAFVITLPPGGDLRDAVRDALSDLGRAFGMAHAVERGRNHRFNPDTDHVLLRAWPFHRWSMLEKEIAPPLVIDLEAADLRASGLAEFLEGEAKFLLRVSGAAPPAPLARLLSPSAFTAQVLGDDEALMHEFAKRSGPGVMAVFEEDSGAIPFVDAPGEATRIDLGALSDACERIEGVRGKPGILDLRHLESWVRGAPEHPGRASAVPVPEAPAVDMLAGWLLGSTDVSVPPVD